jgi:group I intron endonuclease
MNFEGFKHKYKNKKIMGIYSIYNHKLNKYYIGQSMDILNRVISHLNGLKKNKHSNKKLQKDYNGNGLDDFSFEIIKECEAEDLNRYESVYSYELNVWEEGYGIAPLLNYCNLSKENAEKIKKDILKFIFSNIKIKDLKKIYIPLEELTSKFGITLNDLKIAIKSINGNDVDKYNATFYLCFFSSSFEIEEREIISWPIVEKKIIKNKYIKREVTESEINEILIKRNWKL